MICSQNLTEVAERSRIHTIRVLSSRIGNFEDKRTSKTTVALAVVYGKKRIMTIEWPNATKRISHFMLACSAYLGISSRPIRHKNP